MNKEDFFIKQISNSKYNGDDGAFINGYVYSMDAFFENVHFKKEWIDKKIISLKQIAYKSMLVNISDAIAMNAKPKYALISIAIPKSYTNENLKELSSGFKKAARDFNFEIIGGDTIENSKLDISITIVSKTKNPIFRNGVKEGDYLCYTGKLGESKRDLDALLSGKKIKKSSKFIKPNLRADFFYEVAKYINAAMDISDGLFLDLEKLSNSSLKLCILNLSDIFCALIISFSIIVLTFLTNCILEFIILSPHLILLKIEYFLNNILIAYLFVKYPVAPHRSVSIKISYSIIPS